MHTMQLAPQSTYIKATILLDWGAFYFGGSPCGCCHTTLSGDRTMKEARYPIEHDTCPKCQAKGAVDLIICNDRPQGFKIVCKECDYETPTFRSIVAVKDFFENSARLSNANAL